MVTSSERQRERVQTQGESRSVQCCHGENSCAGVAVGLQSQGALDLLGVATQDHVQLVRSAVQRLEADDSVVATQHIARAVPARRFQARQLRMDRGGSHQAERVLGTALDRLLRRQSEQRERQVAEALVGWRLQPFSLGVREPEARLSQARIGALQAIDPGSRRGGWQQEARQRRGARRLRQRTRTRGLGKQARQGGLVHLYQRGAQR